MYSPSTTSFLTRNLISLFHSTYKRSSVKNTLTPHTHVIGCTAKYKAQTRCLLTLRLALCWTYFLGQDKGYWFCPLSRPLLSTWRNEKGEGTLCDAYIRLNMHLIECNLGHIFKSNSRRFAPRPCRWRYGSIFFIWNPDNFAKTF